MNEPKLAGRSQPAPGIIDTLSSGYRAVNQRIWIVLIPIFLDLFLWLGPQVSVSPLVGQMVSGWEASPGLPPDQVQALEEAQRAAVEAADHFSLLSLLAPSMVGVPSLIALIGGQGALLLVESWGAALVIGVAAVLAGLALGAAYFVVIAQQVRDGQFSMDTWTVSTWLAWQRVAVLTFALGALGLAVGLPVVFILTALALVSPVVASLGLALLLVAVVWLQIYLFFAPDAIFISRVGPLEGVRRSFRVVREQFWQAVLLILLIWLILLGMSQVWMLLATSPGGTLVGILGNAYVASGLMAASMIFYYDRLGRKEMAGGQGS